MKLKKKLVTGLFSLMLLTGVSTSVNADVFNLTDSNYDYSELDTKINTKMQELDTKPQFSIAIVNTEEDVVKEGNVIFKEKKLSKNSILLAVNQYDGHATIIIGDDLKGDIVTPQLEEEMLSENGLLQLSLGNFDLGVEELSDSVFFNLNRSSIGENTYDYDSEKIASETVEKEKEKSSKAMGGIIAIISTASVGILLFFLLKISLSNKNSSLYKFLFDNKKETVLEKAMEDSKNLLQEDSFVYEQELDYLHKQFRMLSLESKYREEKSRYENEILTMVNEAIKEKDFKEIEMINLKELLSRITQNEIARIKSRRKELLKKETMIKYIDVPRPVFQSNSFNQLLERTDFTKKMLEEFLIEETELFNDTIKKRELAVKELIKNILSKSKVPLNEEKEKGLYNLTSFINSEYSKTRELPLEAFSKDFEGKIFNYLSEIRIMQLDESMEVKNYLLKNMPKQDIVYASKKMLRRQVEKARLLS